MTLEEINVIFEPSTDALDTPSDGTVQEDEQITEMEPAALAPEQIALLEEDFFSESSDHRIASHPNDWSPV